MARIFPLEITADNISAMLAVVRNGTPYFDDDCTACFDCDAPDIVLCVKIPNGQYDASARHNLEAAVLSLPRFHARVAKSIARDGSSVGDVDLGMVTVDGDDVVLECCCRAFNAQPDYYFSVACHGGPHTPVTFSAEWRTDTVLALAQQMVATNDYSGLPILADALQDAGCDNDDILNHCREPREHERGCWVVDLVLGNE